MGFDRAKQALNALVDWPAHSLDVFIQVVHQNNNKLSLNKRKSHFEWMRDEEISRFEQIIAKSFAPDPELENKPASNITTQI